MGSHSTTHAEEPVDRPVHTVHDHRASGVRDGHTAHGGHADHGDHAALFRDRFWLSLALAVPVVFYSPMVQDWFGYDPPAFPGDGLVAPVVGTAVYLYGGWPFLTGAADEARRRQPGMMLLIAMATPSRSSPAWRRRWASSTSTSGGSWRRSW